MVNKNTQLDTRLLRRAFTDKTGKIWFEFTKTECFVCGKVGHCLVHEDGKVVACTRVESKKLFSKKHTSYLHTFEEGKKIDTSKLATSSNREKPANEVLDSRYRAFLEAMTISDEHLNHFKNDRLLSNEVVEVRKYRTYGQNTVANAKALLGEELYENEQFKSAQMKIGFPGLFLNKENEWEMVKHENGILIPYRNQHMEIVGFQVRATIIKNRVVASESINFNNLYVRIKEQPNLVQVLEDGEIIQEFRLDAGKSAFVQHGEKSTKVKVIKGNRYTWLSSNNYKYGTPSSTQNSPLPVHVAVPSKDLAVYEKQAEQQANSDSYLVNVESEAVWVTEGALKADISVDLITQAYDKEVGHVVLAVPGVNAWRTVIPVLQEMKVKRINLAFDMDAATNEDVMRQYFDMIRYLYQEGYEVYVAKWSVEAAKGLDDILQKRVRPILQRIQPNN